MTKRDLERELSIAVDAMDVAISRMRSIHGWVGSTIQYFVSHQEHTRARLEDIKREEKKR